MAESAHENRFMTATRGGGRSGRAIRHRGPRRRPGRLCHRALRRRGGARTSPSWKRIVSGDVPAPGVHPGQGAPPDRRGAAHGPRARRIRHRRRRPACSTWPRSQVRKQEVVDRLTKGLETLLKGRKVTVFAGRGEVADGRRAPRAHRRRHRGGGRATWSWPPAPCPARCRGLDFDGDPRAVVRPRARARPSCPPRVASSAVA